MLEEAEAAVECAPDQGEFGYFAAMAAGYSLIDAAHHQDEDRMNGVGKRIFHHLETVLQNHPDHHRARYLLVQQSIDTAPEIGLEVGDPEKHVELQEREAPILGAKARCCLVGEEERRAISSELLAAHPEDGRALVEAAEGLIEIGDRELAATCLDMAIAKDAQVGYGLLRLGLAHAMQQDWDQAVELTQEYLDLEPPVALKAFATGRLAMIYHRKGDKDRAGELMARARELDSHVWQTLMPPPQEMFTPVVPDPAGPSKL